jgi:hypothetical protein
MNNRIETEYVFVIEQALKNIDEFEKKAGNLQATISKMGNNPSFDNLGKSINSTNQKLLDGSKIYRQVESNAKAYKAEVERLTLAEKALIKAQIEFSNSASYDNAEEKLITVRKRIAEINAGLEETGGQTKKAGGLFSNFGSLAKTALIGAAAFFTVDKLISVEGSIIEATRTYEKYFAVLRNGFQDENKASQSLELIYNFASKTPFSVNELTESFIKLTGRGFVPTEVEMRKLGDLASSQGKQFDQLTEAVLDAASNEYERLKEFGISATTAGDKVTLSFRNQETTIDKFNKGAIKDAILGFGDLKGVAGSMGAVSVTLDGQISNLGDSWEQLLTSLGQSQGFLKDIVSGSINVINTLKEWVSVPIEQKIRGEQTELNMLVNSLQLAAGNEELVGQIRAEISQKYPSFLKLIDLERSTNTSLANALELVNVQYENKIKLAGLDVIAQKNAGSKAKLIQEEGDALQKLIPLIEKAGITESKFLTLNKKQQDAVIKSQIEKQFPQDKILQSGVSKGRYESNKALNTFLDFDKKYKEEENARRGVDALVKKQGKDVLFLEQEKIDKIKTQNELIKKQGLLSEEQLNKAIKAQQKGGKITDGEKRKIEDSKTYYSNQNIIGKGLIDYKNAEFTVPKPTAPKTSTATSEKTHLKNRLDEIESLKKAEQKYKDELSKITLDQENVRLQLMDKESQTYLDKKLQYDQKVIDAENEKYKELYQIELENQILFEELAKRKGEKITEIELDNLKEQSKTKAKDINSNLLDPKNYNNAGATSPQRDLIEAKRDSVVQSYFDGVKKIEEKGIKEQQDRLDVLNSLLGDGIEKQTATIEEKYKKLIEKYKDNLEMVDKLESKKGLEIADLKFVSENKKEDDIYSKSKKVIENRTKPSGVNIRDFEQKKNQDLIDLDVVFYTKKIELQKEYNKNQLTLQAVASGQVSLEAKEQNEEKLKDYQDALDRSNQATQKALALNLLSTKKSLTGWDIVGEVYSKITGKAMKLASDPEVEEAIKESISNSLNSLKDSLSLIHQMQIDSSEARIKTLDDEINSRESKLSNEQERYKQGLANNYESEKLAIDKKKEERSKEIEHKKKLQKEQAVIDNLSIIGTNAVTVADTIGTAVKALKGHSGIPFVGIALGLAAVATIMATVASVTARTKQANRLRYGGKVRGNLHEIDGGVEVGNTGLFVEGNEYVNRREVVSKSPQFFEAINDGSFERLDAMSQRRLLKPFGLNVFDGKNTDAKINSDNLKQYKTAKEKQGLADYHYKKMSLHLGAVAENTSRIPEHQIVADSNGNLLIFNRKGKIIEIIDKK